jgi:hypothetical protein
MAKIDVDSYLETLRGGKCIAERDVRIVCEKVKSMLIEESNV